ncbi:hypothetical protein F8M41_007766 [Gigaspora margarita]|uniref:Uncharacterized protein n=1 Tax=Gigaspora margarita TaxID=4874 RepID=A0A8H3X585_GIGMA|nr:hypothetical protein F8M41_007766 [Gigaspora margarita]
MNIDINEYDEYDDLYARKPRDLKDINQKFPSEEYAEFMHIYSNRDDHPLPSTSQGGQAFIEDLNLPYFG